MAQGLTGTIVTTLPSEIGLFQGRLDYATTTTVKLNPNKGRYVEVDGYLMDIAASLTLTTTDNRIDSSGANAAAAMTTSTLYYIYVGNSIASYGAGSLRASTVAPTLVDGVKYLGATGNARNWRFVGWARTNGSTQFVDSETQRFVVCYYNRKKVRLHACPAYSDNNALTTYTTTSTTYVEANGGTGNKVEFISNGEDVVELELTGGLANNTANAATHIGIGEDSTTVPKFDCRDEVATIGALSGSSCANKWAATENYHYASMLIRVNTGTGSYYADFDLSTGADVKMTYLEGAVWI